MNELREIKDYLESNMNSLKRTAHGQYEANQIKKMIRTLDSINTPKHETVAELRDLLTHMVNKSNKVTSMNRHGVSSSQKSVNELYTAQLKAEKYLNGKPEIEG